MIRTGLGSLLMCGLLLAGCGDDSGRDQPEAGSASDATADAEAVVKQYVMARADGRLDDADELECRANHLPADRRQFWLDQLDEFKKKAGPIGDVTVAAKPRTGMTPGDPALADPIEVEYRIELDGRRRDPLLAVTVLEDGKRKVCGRATPQAARIYSEVQDVPVGPDTALQPKELLPASGPDGHSQTSDEAIQPDGAYEGAAGGWQRLWADDDGFGGFRAEAIAFRDDDAARSAAMKYLLSGKVGDAVEVLRSPERSYVLGLRVSAYAWLGVQPPDVGPYTDFVASVFGDVFVSIGQGDVREATSPAVSVDLMDAVGKTVETARS